MKADQTAPVAKLSKVPPVTTVPSETGAVTASSGSSPPAEFFKLHDRRSIKKLHVNLRGEENSPRSYLQFMLALLNLNPVITQAELETELLEHFSSSFGPEDVRKMKVGKRGKQPKWKNSLAWAKVVARKQKTIAWRKRGKVTYIVSLSPAQNKEHRRFRVWAKRRTVKKMKKKIRIKRRPNVRQHKMVMTD
jgi:hypothetical protein